MTERIQRILCISTYEKGQGFLRQCAEMGVRPTLLTLEKHRKGDWPRDALEDLVAIPEDLTSEQVRNTVCWMARGRRFDRIVALDEFDQETAAALREHMRLPGMNLSATAYYRDKLAMRAGASERGFLVPGFSSVLNYDDLRVYMESVPAPWLLKPRSEASALGIRKINDPEQLWRALDELGDRQSNFILERFLPGDIFHVDSIVAAGRVAFSVVHQYGKPPMQVMHEGGVFTTRTVDRRSEEWAALTELNYRLAPSMGLSDGVTHAEYIRAYADGRFYFLEIAARVGGAFISELVETASGINLWREWARIEVAQLRGEPYMLPPIRQDYAGSILCLAQTAEPDTSQFDAPEIVFRMKKHHHAGLIVRSDRPERVHELQEGYAAEFARLYLASLPAPEKPTA
jgi:biotin carboxylase